MFKFDPTISFSDAAVVLAIMLFGWRIISHMSKMEFKVDLMWNAFKEKFLNHEEKEAIEERHRKGR